MNHVVKKNQAYPTAEKMRAVKEAKKSATTATEAAKSNATPMMVQYFSIKQNYPDYLLFYRMGDFYELFFDDAVIAAEILDIALTRRGKHDDAEIPMCGVPHHSHESYLHKLIQYGQKVAICDQMESPVEAKKRGPKSVVRREVVRVITPGTLTEDSLLDAKSSNYLLAIISQKDSAYLAWADISTGEFHHSQCHKNDLAAEISRINPSEILAPDELPFTAGFEWLNSTYRKQLSTFVVDFFDASRGQRKLMDFFGTKTLESFAIDEPKTAGVAGSLIAYLELTQLNNMPHLEAPKHYSRSEYMVIDAATRRNLELARTTSGDYKGSLLHTINRTKTGFGARLLSEWLHAPLTCQNAIRDRQNAVAYLLDNAPLNQIIRQSLADSPDMERALSRLYVARGGPRDLAMIRDGLGQASRIKNELQQHQLPALLSDALIKLGTACSSSSPESASADSRAISDGDRDSPRIPQEKNSGNDGINIHQLLESALNQQVGFHARDGGFIREGYSDELDRHRNAKYHADERQQELKEHYAETSGIKSLKIKKNNVIGLFIEVTPQSINDVPDNFVHRQTLASAVRYTTPELRALEEELIHAESYALECELALFESLRQHILQQHDMISQAARALAMLDACASLATIAEERNYHRPEIDDSTAFAITKGRHPAVEAISDSAFIANDCRLENHQRLWLMTGPNMAGKSTFLRQNALIVIMAQMGGFVPADQAHIGVVDRVFSRVGAADDLARGQSTFMVEMVETATILHQATEKSLVILDEIGRGTATFDGLSIAWAVVEQLHDKTRARALFATHYHELTLLEQRLESLACYTMKVREWEKDVIFLHQVEAGSAKRSYGIHVAKLAGLPPAVIKRAQDIMAILSQNENQQSLAKLAEDLPLFAPLNAQNSEDDTAEHPALTRLQSLDIDSMTPRDALNALYELKKDFDHGN